MSKLDELIQELCPNGVPYVELGTIAKGQKERNKGKKCNLAFSITKGGLVKTSDYFKEATVTSEDTSSYKLVKRNWFVYSPSRIDVGSINYLKDEELVIVSPLNVVFSISEDKILPQYLLYFLQSRFGTWQIMTKREGIEGTGRKLLPFERFSTIIVPLPPLDVQREVVKILDSFEKLISELTAELTARKKQYWYYCRSLIDSAEETVETRIGDFGRWSGGMTPSMSNKSFWDNGTIPWVSSKDMKTAFLMDTQDHITQTALQETSIKLMPKDTVAIVARSGILKHTLPVVYIPIEVTVNQDIKILVTAPNVLPMYAYYSLLGYQSDILVKTKKQGGTVDSLEIDKFMDFKIPVPPIAEQKRIVDILTRFDSLCNDLSTGLPAEIEARQKQYEYYRDKLLSFKELPL